MRVDDMAGNIRQALLLGMQMFGYQYIFCDSYELSDDVQPLCPPGIASKDCPKR